MAAFERQWRADAADARSAGGSGHPEELSAAEWERVSRLLAVQGVACTPQEARLAEKQADHSGSLGWAFSKPFRRLQPWCQQNTAKLAPRLPP